MTGAAFSTEFTREFDRLLRWRRDVRHFHRHALPEDILDDLLHCAAIAPSVGLSQPWRFIRVDDPARRLKIRDEFERCNLAARAEFSRHDAMEYARLKLAGLEDAPHHVAVFSVSDPSQGRGLGRHTMPQTVHWSVIMAIYNFWLAAAARGIGVGWVSILDPAAMCQIIDVDSDWEFIAYLCVGYPSKPSERPELEEKNWAARHPDRCRWIYR